MCIPFSTHLSIATLSTQLQSCRFSWTVRVASQQPSESVLHRSLAKQEQTEIKMSIKTLSQQQEGQSQQGAKAKLCPQTPDKNGCLKADQCRKQKIPKMGKYKSLFPSRLEKHAKQLPAVLGRERHPTVITDVCNRVIMGTLSQTPKKRKPNQK